MAHRVRKSGRKHVTDWSTMSFSSVHSDPESLIKSVPSNLPLIGSQEGCWALYSDIEQGVRHTARGGEFAGIQLHEWHFARIPVSAGPCAVPVPAACPTGEGGCEGGGARLIGTSVVHVQAVHTHSLYAALIVPRPWLSPLFEFRNNAQFAAPISPAALIGPN
jgi:hypothetical protein